LLPSILLRSCARKPKKARARSNEVNATGPSLPVVILARRTPKWRVRCPIMRLSFRQLCRVRTPEWRVRCRLGGLAVPQGASSPAGLVSPSNPNANIYISRCDSKSTPQPQATDGAKHPLEYSPQNRRQHRRRGRLSNPLAAVIPGAVWTAWRGVLRTSDKMSEHFQNIRGHEEGPQVAVWGP
jgi:hypothetical protein